MSDSFQYMFSRDLIFLDVEADSWEDLLKKLGNILHDRGYVTDDYVEALLEREKEYPTALPTEGVKVALPHTYAQYSLRPAILVANLKKPVVFKEMGNSGDDIPVELVFSIVVTDPKSQIIVLKKLMDIFSKKKVLKELKKANTIDNTYEILKREFLN